MVTDILFFGNLRLLLWNNRLILLLFRHRSYLGVTTRLFRTISENREVKVMIEVVGGIKFIIIF